MKANLLLTLRRWRYAVAVCSLTLVAAMTPQMSVAGLVQYKLQLLRESSAVRHWFYAALTCVVIFLTAPHAVAQSGGRGDGASPSRPESVLTHEADGSVVVHATRITQPIRLDGRLDDGPYKEVLPVTEFIQQEPTEGAPISEKTEAWVLFDDENIYISCRCWHEHPERIVANDLRRDGVSGAQHDHFAVILDTFHDRRNGFRFDVTAAGGMRDGTITDERPNMNWNGVWDGKATRFEGGWIAEMAVPFKSLRYKPGQNQTWGIQLRRFINSGTERAHLTALSPAGGTTATNRLSEAAMLVGLETPPPGLNFEVKPFAISRMTTDRLSRPAVENDVDSDFGVDVKYGVTKSLTADFTYHTDFAQVEADEAQVNLTRFSLSFPEKREFFLEGGGIFNFGTAAGVGMETAPPGDAPTVFYSRRIGLNESGSREVPVIAGGRFTGRAGPWGIGAFTMETDDHAAANAAQTNFTVLRLRRDILRRGNVGGIFTRRSVSTAAPGANDVWGLDTNFAFYENVYLAGYVARSRTEGLAGDDVSYRAQLNYSGDRYGLVLDRLVVDPNFNPEVGFLRRENFRRNFAQARFSPRTTGNRVVRRWTSQGSFEYITDDTNRLESREASALFETEFHSSDSLSVQYFRLFEFLREPFEISPGVRIPIGGYSFATWRTQFQAGQQHRVSGWSTFEAGSFYGGDKKTATFRGRVEITPQLGVEPNISLNWIDLPQGSFTTTVVGGRTTFTMSARMFAAALVQYSSSSTSLVANLRFRWEYQPGSEFFIVYTEGRSTFPVRGTELEGRGFVVKVNRLLRF